VFGGRRLSDSLEADRVSRHNPIQGPAGDRVDALMSRAGGEDGGARIPVQ